MAEKTAVADREELPKTIVRRLVKDTVSKCSKDGDVSVLKDSLTAFSVSSRIFIQYLSATAKDLCKESKRNIITADDVFKALEEIEFPEFVEPLKASLKEFKKKNSVKRSGPSIEEEPGKKSKVQGTQHRPAIETEPRKKSKGKGTQHGPSIETEPKKKSKGKGTQHGPSFEKEPSKKSKVQGTKHGNKESTESTESRNSNEDN